MYSFLKEYIMTTTAEYCVYTDGACSGNGKMCASAGIGIFFGVNDPRNVSRKVVGKQTNNTAELTAIIETYAIIEADILAGKRIDIVSDSMYAIRATTSYGKKCWETQWRTDIPNKELVMRAFELYRDKPNVQFKYVRAHTKGNDEDSRGNAEADKLAKRAVC